MLTPYTMDGYLKIGAVFSLAPDDTSRDKIAQHADDTPTKADDDNQLIMETEIPKLTDETSDRLRDESGETVYTEMTDDDCVGSSNNVAVTMNETEAVLTGVDPEMNSSADVNDLEIDVEDADISMISAECRLTDVSADNPPELPMEENVEALSSVFQDEIEEALPPPVLSPIMNESTKIKKIRVKQEPPEYDAAHEWTPPSLARTSTKDIQPFAPSETKKKCTKIFPCYIVLTDISPLIRNAKGASYRFIRGLRKTECFNMCKKMHFRRRLKAGKNVFNVKTPSYLEKRLKYFEKIGENRLSPKSKSEYTKLKYPEFKEKLSETLVYPHMFMTRAGVKYSFRSDSGEKKSETKQTKMEDESVKQKVEKLSERQKELAQKKEEAQREKEKLARDLEFKRQLGILSEQIKMKREENFHIKAMRKSKQELPFLQPGISARSGRVRKPNTFFTEDLFAFNKTDIQGYKKLSALQEKQRKVLAEMKQKENRAKRVNRIVVKTPRPSHSVSNNNEKLENVFKNVLSTKSHQQKSKADLEIDNPEKEDGVRKLEINDSISAKKRKLYTTGEIKMMETKKKKSKRNKDVSKSDGVLIGEFPDTTNVMKFLEEESKKSTKKLKPNGNQNSETDSMLGAENTSSAYPYARSLLKASKDLEEKEASQISPDLLKGVMFVDAKKGEPVKFKVGAKELMMAKCGEKFLVYSPTTLKRIDTSNKNKIKTDVKVKVEPGVSVSETASCIKQKASVASALSVNSLTPKTVSTSMHTTQTNGKSNLEAMRGVLKGLLNPIPNVGGTQNSVSQNLIQFPLMSMASSSAGFIQIPSTQAILVNPLATKPTFIVNPGVSGSIYAPLAVSGASLLAIPTTSVSAALPSPMPIMAVSAAASSFTSPPSAATLLTSVPMPAPPSMSGTSSVTMAAPGANRLQTFKILPKSGSLPPVVVPLQQKASVGTKPIPQSTVAGVANLSTAESKTSLSLPITTGETSLASSSQGQKTTPTSTQSQERAGQKKGKFYLLKVDGKHILIPVPDSSSSDATVHTKAYLVNDLPKGGITRSVMTPIPTQTLNVPLAVKSTTKSEAKVIPLLKKVKTLDHASSPQNANVTQPLQTRHEQTTSNAVTQTKQNRIAPTTKDVNSSNSMVPMSTVPKSSQTDPNTTQTSVLSYKVVTSYNPPGGGPKSIVESDQKPVLSLIPNTVASIQPKSGTSPLPARSVAPIVVSVSSGYKHKVVPSMSSCVSSVQTTNKLPLYATAISSIQSTSSRPATTVVTNTSFNKLVMTSPLPHYTTSTTLACFTSNQTSRTVTVVNRQSNSVLSSAGANGCKIAASVIKPGVISLLTGTPVTASLSSACVQPTVVKVQSKITPVTKVNGHEPNKLESGSVQMCKDKEKSVLEDKANDMSKTADASEKDVKSQPFIANREERLKKLKELIKQKNEAVEQIRQSLSKTSSVDNTEKQTIDGAEV